MSTNNSIEHIICRTKGSGEEQRERELGKEKGDEIIAKNADKQKESGLEKTDKICVFCRIYSTTL